MSESLMKKFKALNFVGNIFKMSIGEIEETLGYETLTMIFRRVGERSAEIITKRLEGKYTTGAEFAELIVKTVIIPVLGEGNASSKEVDGKVKIIFNQCPYQESGKFILEDAAYFCHYTEGLIDHAFKLAFPDKTVLTTPIELLANKCSKCEFDVEF